MVILIVPTARPEDIASFAQRVAANWKLGRKEVGDGLLVTIAKNDHDANIQVAATLQGAIPDVIAGRIIREQMLPAFKAGDFAGGLNAAVDRLGALVAGEKLPAPSLQATSAARRPAATRGFDWQDLAIFLFVGVPIVGRVLASVMGRKLGALATGARRRCHRLVADGEPARRAGAGIVALFLVGVMGFGASRGGGFGGAGDLGRRRFRWRRRWLRRWRRQRRLQLGRRRQLRRRRRLGTLVMAHWLARLLRHRLLDETDAHRLLGAGALERIEAAVAASELRHQRRDPRRRRGWFADQLPASRRQRARPRHRLVRQARRLGHRGATTASSSTCCSPSGRSRSSPTGASSRLVAPSEWSASRRARCEDAFRAAISKAA